MGVGAVNAAVFLDRDGVLNQTIVRDGVPHPPAHVSACVLLPGVREACEHLRSAGYLLFVVTNQPDVARGHQMPRARRRHQCLDTIHLTSPAGADVLPR